ncbi:MAG: two-component regulator propeller domain-containing protein [Spirochaetia bacterium]
MFKIEDYTVSTWNTFSGLASDSIITIFQDKEKYLWIGTENEGLVRARDGEFHTYTAADGLPSNSVLSLAYDPEGRLWIGTSRGLCYYDGNSFHVPVCAGENPFPDRNISGLVYHWDAGLLVASGAGLYGDGDSDPVLIPDTREVAFSAVWADQNGTVWCGTRDGRFFFWDGDSLNEKIVDGMKHTHIRSIYGGGPSGNLLVARDGGFWSIEDGGFGTPFHAA